MRYRIVPFQVSDWKVQSWAWWFPIWCDETRSLAYGLDEPVWFATAEEAEKWVRGALEFRAANIRAKRITRARRRDIKPREYPGTEH